MKKIQNKFETSAHSHGAALSAYSSKLNVSVYCIHSQVIELTNLGKVVTNVVRACSHKNHVLK